MKLIRPIAIAALTVASLGTAANAGALVDPIVEPEVIIEEASSSSSAGMLIPLLLVILLVLKMGHHNSPVSHLTNGY